MARKKGAWTVEESTVVYRNSWFEVGEDKVIRPDKSPGSFATVRMRSGVSALALDTDGYVYLTSEYRYAIERESIEAASGAIEGDESALTAAQRELREELGIIADEWIDLGSVDPFTSIVVSPAQLYLARKLQHTTTAHDEAEIIEPRRVKFEEAVRMVINGEITHGPSCVLILKAHHFLSNQS